MARFRDRFLVRAGGKLLVAAILLGVTLHVSGLTARTPAPQIAPAQTTAAKPVKTSTPATKPTPKPTDEPFRVKRILEIPGPFRHGDYAWNEDGVPPSPVVITVDLKAQTLSVFRGGYEIGAAVILYGADDKPTPLGVFPVLQKKAHHISNLYNAPMPYMLRLTNDGVAIHGSGVIATDRATHGCIGLPVEFAKLLFGQVKLGDKVIVTDGKMMDLGKMAPAA